MFYVYISTNKPRGILYTGHTDDLSARMEQHKQKIFGGFTAKYGCDKLVWFMEFPSREAAFKKERQIKKWKRAYKLNVIELENPFWSDIDEQVVWPPVQGHLPVVPAPV
jgi:putative endonuclease